jgi:hypothetical protein
MTALKQSIRTPQLASSKSVLLLPSCLHPNGLFPRRFPIKMCVHFLCATSEHAQSILNYTRFHSSEEGGLVLKRRFSALQLYYETQHFIPVVFKHFTERLIFEHL